MIIKVLSTFTAFFLGCNIPVKIGTVKSVIIYSKFIKQGSTNNIRNAFDFPERNNVDKSSNLYYVVENDSFGNSIKTAKVTKHWQQKLAGITFAGEFIENNKRHFFAYFHSSKLLIDFSEMKNYLLADSIKYIKRKNDY